MGFRQIPISHLVCKRAIVVRNLGVPQRRPGAFRHHLDYRYRFFLKTAAGVILRALARGQGNMGRRLYTRIETGLTIPAYMSATCTISCGFYKTHRTEKPVLGTLTVDRTSGQAGVYYAAEVGP